MKMAEKKEVPDGWPLVTGDYEVGDPKSCVAVCSTGSYFYIKYLPGIAAQGPCKTENIGLEKMMSNIISNPNIRFLIMAGAEVPGHITAGAMLALWKNGIDESGKIIGTKAAIPFIENLPRSAVERFRKQVEVIDMVGVEDYGALVAKINELKGKDPGAYPEDAMVVKIEAEEEEVAAVIDLPLTMPAAPFMGVINRATADIVYKTQLIARDQKLSSGLSMNYFVGLLAGFISIFLFLLPLIIWGVM